MDIGYASMGLGAAMMLLGAGLALLWLLMGRAARTARDTSCDSRVVSFGPTPPAIPGGVYVDRHGPLISGSALGFGSGGSGGGGDCGGSGGDSCA